MINSIKRITFVLSMAAVLGGIFCAAPTLKAQAQPKAAPVSKAITAIGIVVGAPRMSDFDFRTSAATYRVRFHSKTQMQNVQGGDQVRVYGKPLGLVITGANVKLLKKRASDIADDYDRQSVQKVGDKDPVAAR